MEYEQITENEDGWSDWIQPNHASYLMKCCDCGLVHELQFRVVADTPHDLVDTDDEIPGLVVFRASRRDDLKEKDMSTDNQIEQEIQAKGLTAPRITLADIEGNIAREYFFTAADGVAQAEGLDFCDSEGTPALGRLTFCVLVLRNGFTVTGESACVSPENFDAEKGRKYARENAIDKVWPLMGYELRSKLAWRQGPRTGEQEGGAS